MSADRENELALVARATHGENAVEFLVGALSSVTTARQLDALVAALRSRGTGDEECK